MYWKRARILFLRALIWRCPVCGEGKLYRGIFKTYDNCPVCNFAFEREPGYYTGAMAINLVLSEFLITAISFPLFLTPGIPVLTWLIWGSTMPILFPLIFYRHTKSFWMAFDHLLHPVNNERVFFPE